MKFTYTHISKDYTEITKYKVNKSNKIIKINNMFKIKENDIFAKNMSRAELHQVYKQKQDESQQAKQLFEECGFQYKAKAYKEMDKFLNKIIAENGTTKI